MAGEDAVMVTDVILVDVFYGAGDLPMDLLFPSSLEWNRRRPLW